MIPLTPEIYIMENILPPGGVGEPMSFGGKIYKRKRKGQNVKKGLKMKER
jgi:hypothetical protein